MQDLAGNFVKEGDAVDVEDADALFMEDNQKDKIVEVSPKERFYRFNQEIGYGSYKSVYRGHDSDTGREIAWNVIKLMKLPAQQRKRITEQISILKNISHKKIINFINAWINKSRNQMIFITEMVSGGSLNKHLHRIKKPRLKIIKGWCKEILEGLNYLHSQKPNPIIHRDIKCQNIFINTNTNQIRIGDLGLAISTKNSFAQTQIGTPQFMAPEIFQGKYSTGVDIYAFGMCVLEMATLRTPYQECKNKHQVYKLIEQRIKPKCLDLIQSETLKKFISKCLNDFQERPSAQQLLQDEFFLPHPEDDNKEVKLKQITTIVELSQQYESTLTKPEFKNMIQKKNTMNSFKFEETEKGQKAPLTPNNNFLFRSVESKNQIKMNSNMQHAHSVEQLKGSSNNISIEPTEPVELVKMQINRQTKQMHKNYLLKNLELFKSKNISENEVLELQIKSLIELKESANSSVKNDVQTSQRCKRNKTNSSHSSSLSKRKWKGRQNKYKYSETVLDDCHFKKDQILTPQQCYQTKSLAQASHENQNHSNLTWADEPKSKDVTNPDQNSKINENRTHKELKFGEPDNSLKQTDKKLNHFGYKIIENIVEKNTKEQRQENIFQSKKNELKQSAEKIETKSTEIKHDNRGARELITEHKSVSQPENAKILEIDYQYLTSSNTKRDQPVQSKYQQLVKPQTPKSPQQDEYQRDLILLKAIKRESIKLPITKDHSSKEDVTVIQNVLGRLLDQKVQAIGVFGLYTQELVKRFQEYNKLRQDGIIDQHVFSVMVQQMERKFVLTEREKQLKEKSQELERIRREKNQESRKLLSELENQIMQGEI